MTLIGYSFIKLGGTLDSCMKSTNEDSEAKCQETIGDWTNQGKPLSTYVQLMEADMLNTPTFTRSRHYGFVQAYIKR